VLELNGIYGMATVTKPSTMQMVTFQQPVRNRKMSDATSDYNEANEKNPIINTILY